MEGLLERLKERMQREFGITTPEVLEAAVEEIDLDISIFAMKTGEGEANAS